MALVVAADKTVSEKTKQTELLKKKGSEKAPQSAKDGEDLIKSNSKDNIYRKTILKTKSENDPQIVAFFERLPRDGKDAMYALGGENSKLNNFARECLDEWVKGNYHYREGKRGTIVKGKPDGIRLDLQNRYQDKKSPLEYANLQMQVNGKSRATNGGKSTTVGEVQISYYLLTKYPALAEQAFRQSLEGGYGVHVGVYESE